MLIERPKSAPKSTVAWLLRIVGLTNEHPRPEPTPTVAELSRTEHRAEPPAPEPELSLGGVLDVPGVGKVRGSGGARGTPAVVALHRVLIVLGVVVALVVGAHQAHRAHAARRVHRADLYARRFMTWVVRRTLQRRRRYPRIEHGRSRYIDPSSRVADARCMPEPSFRLSLRASRVADARCMPEPSFRLSLRASRRSATLAVDVDVAARGRPAIAAVALLVVGPWWLP